MHLATAELRRRQQLHAGQFSITAHRLADFLVSVEGREALLLQRLRDLEARGSTTSVPVARAAGEHNLSLPADHAPGAPDGLGDEDYGEYR